MCPIFLIPAAVVSNKLCRTGGVQEEVAGINRCIPNSTRLQARPARSIASPSTDCRQSQWRFLSFIYNPHMEEMRFCERRYLRSMLKALAVAQYLGWLQRCFHPFPGDSRIPNIGPPASPVLIAPLAKMHFRIKRILQLRSCRPIELNR